MLIKPCWLLALATVSCISLAQEGRTGVFADPQNLKVLPTDISADELGSTMRGFAIGLGARCETCHVGEAGQPLETFDFAADEKAMKRKARLMLEMTQNINAEFVPQLDRVEGASRVDVRCVTCHRGQPQPKLIEDVLDERRADAGIENAVAIYRDLRKQYYGSHSYDFSEFVLPMYAQGLVKEGAAGDGIVLAELNTENFPESYYSFFVLGELQASVGDTAAASSSYRRAVELNPRAAAFLEAKIAAFEKAPQ